MKCKLPKWIICCIFFAIVIVLLVQLWYCGVVAFDRSASVYAEGMTWKNREYSRIDGQYSEGRTLAKSEDGNWKINAVKEDPSHTFVVARAFLDQYLYVADDYTIPTSGKITTACWNSEYIENQEFIEAIAEIDAIKTTTFDYETEAIYYLKDHQRMKALYVAYEGCPVATVSKGWLGKINGQWVITTYLTPNQSDESAPPSSYTVGCYAISNQYWPILENYFFE